MGKIADGDLAMMPLRLAVPLLSVLVVASAFAGEPAEVKMSAQEKKLLELTNAERKKKDLPPLQPNALLAKIARAHSANMAQQQKMDHFLDGKSPADRVAAAG